MMMRIVYTVITLALVLVLNVASSGQERFHNVFGGDGYDTGAEIIQKSDGNYLIAGSSGSYDTEMSSQIIMMEITSNGLVEWSKTYGGQFADQAESMVQDIDGNYLIAGFTETTENSYQGYAIKLTSSGDTLWTRKYGGQSWDFFRQALALPDGGFALFGQTYSFGSGEGDFYLVRTNELGDTLWTKTYGGVDDESGHAVTPTADGGFYLTGHTRSYGAGGSDGYFIKTDQFGDTIWTRTLGKSEDEFFYGATTTFDDGLVAVGGSFSNTPGEADFLSFKLKANGDSVRARFANVGTDEYWTDVVEYPDTKSLIFCGWVDDSNWGKTDFRYQKVTKGLWYDGISVSRGSPENDLMFDVKITADNGFVMVGVTSGFLNRFDDIYVHKVDANGVDAINTSVSVEELIVDGETFKFVAYPNPFEEELNLEIGGYESIIRNYDESPSLRLINAFGQEVALYSIDSGFERIELNNLESGIYFYELIAGSKSLTKGKIIKVSSW